ncbi:MAG TPA: tRNA dihydrouridine(20/20a) synthase DusA [Steroidobacteraceae bacterium]|nr:tRNA dihydrouridine(20/20a) synthase DusA [Steroidobacteraceae bacterium]
MTPAAESATFGSQSFQAIDRRVCVAPMMDWTDRHCRYFLRGFSPRVLLYTEMITSAAIVRGDRSRLLEFDPEEHPVALQLGGSDARELAAAARAGEQAGYDEINLNCGCPSDRVASGDFGACLMREPQKVAECIAAMRAAVRVPVTVKMRIGVVQGRGAQSVAAGARFDEADAQALHAFVEAVRAAGCETVIIHARKAVLGGLSPKDNREVPPLRYDIVRAVRAEFPGVRLVLNGGLRTCDAILDALSWCDGVMLGREAYHRPILLAELHESVFSNGPHPQWSHSLLLERMVRYCERELAKGERLSSITRHMLGLHSGEPGAREYRRVLSEGARVPGADPTLLRRAAAVLAPAARAGAPP